ncbi:MAG: tetraacyldisaccharide 4'-kinase [Campylobacterota bacterium]
MNSVVFFIERVFYNPSLLHRLLSYLLLPLSLLYGSIMFLRRKLATSKDYHLPIISVGNLTVGGTGKTPFIITLAKHYTDVAVIMRGYGRKSQGLKVVSYYGTIKEDVATSGDEATLIAKQTQACVIVSKDRDKAIQKAKELGCKLILLDDGFSKVGIKKFEILLFLASLPNRFTLPSGPFREFLCTKKYADLCLYEDRDYTKKVTITHPSSKMLLVTAIANPKRLDRFLPDTVIDKIYFKDHAFFDGDMIKKMMKERGAQSILVTQKDLVKIDFEIPHSVMELTLEIAPKHLEKIDHYINRFKTLNMV